jgi:hypothetical protein
MRRGTVEAAIGRALRKFSEAQLAAAGEVLDAITDSLADETEPEA